jgi:perosamine synthetase
MIGRRQLPVSSPLTAGALGTAVAQAAGRRNETLAELARALETRFGAHAIALTDSGTSGLVLAMRMAAPAGGTVALPGYACVDLLTAARGAGVRVRFYDVVPETLSPDLDSVQAALARGADAIVVAHLYGYPADLPGVRALADAHGATVIEDAAQQAGGSLAGTRLGAFGPLSVLSFGRGKGTTGGRGGALMARDDAWADRVASARLGLPPAGWGDLWRAAAQWAVGRPSLYGIPASIPVLRLGETVYHPPHEPASLSIAAARLVITALARADADRTARAAVADRLRVAVHGGVQAVRPLGGAISGELRLPVLASAARDGMASSGVVRSYPRPLDTEPEAAGLVWQGEPPCLGAREVCATLWTLPTHAMVTERDIRAIGAWAATRV